MNSWREEAGSFLKSCFGCAVRCDYEIYEIQGLKEKLYQLELPLIHEPLALFQ